MFEIELIASAPGHITESIEFLSAGFTAILQVHAEVLPRGAQSRLGHDVRVCDE